MSVNVICFGDSITHGSGHPRSARWTSIFQKLLETWRPGDYTVFNKGISGDTTSRGMDRFEADVLPLLPGILIVEFGFNDANCKVWMGVPRVSPEEYRRNLSEFCRIAAAHDGRAMLVANHPVNLPKAPQGDGRSYAGRMARYNGIVRAVGREGRIPVIDIPALLKRRGIPLGVFLSDGVHLTEAGNRAYAAMVFDRFKEVFG